MYNKENVNPNRTSKRLLKIDILSSPSIEMDPNLSYSSIKQAESTSKLITKDDTLMKQLDSNARNNHFESSKKQLTYEECSSVKINEKSVNELLGVQYQKQEIPNDHRQNFFTSAISKNLDANIQKTTQEWEQRLSQNQQIQQQNDEQECDNEFNIHLKTHQKIEKQYQKDEIPVTQIHQQQQQKQKLQQQNLLQQPVIKENKFENYIQEKTSENNIQEKKYQIYNQNQSQINNSQQNYPNDQDPYTIYTQNHFTQNHNNNPQQNQTKSSSNKKKSNKKKKNQKQQKVNTDNFTQYHTKPKQIDYSSLLDEREKNISENSHFNARKQFSNDQIDYETYGSKSMHFLSKEKFHDQNQFVNFQKISEESQFNQQKNNQFKEFLDYLKTSSKSRLHQIVQFPLKLLNNNKNVLKKIFNLDILKRQTSFLDTQKDIISINQMRIRVKIQVNKTLLFDDFIKMYSDQPIELLARNFRIKYDIDASKKDWIAVHNGSVVLEQQDTLEQSEFKENDSLAINYF